MNKRLMVIEDNPDLLDIYQICLEKDGYEVMCAYDGEDALKKFLDFKPQVILCDIKMPKLTGFDVIEVITSYSRLKKNTTIIIMSAYDDKSMLAKAEELGIDRDRYLVKSQVTLDEVLKIIRKAFET